MPRRIRPTRRGGAGFANDVLAVLRQKAKLLSAKGQRVPTCNGPGNGNLWTILIAQQSQLSVIVDSLEVRGQVEAVYARPVAWIKCLSEDGLVGKSLNTLKPMKLGVQGFKRPADLIGLIKGQTRFCH